MTFRTYPSHCHENSLFVSDVKPFHLGETMRIILTVAIWRWWWTTRRVSFFHGIPSAIADDIPSPAGEGIRPGGIPKTEDLRFMYTIIRRKIGCFVSKPTPTF